MRNLRWRVAGWSCGVMLASAAVLAAASRPVAVHAADPAATGDGTRNAAAAHALRSGPLPRDRAQVEAKAAANARARLRRAEHAVASGRAQGAVHEIGGPPTTAGLVDIAGAAGTLPTLAIAGGRSFAGQFDPESSPSDSTGAIGPTRYVQLVNSRFGIYNRTSNGPVGTGTLNALAGVNASVSAFDPQVIWDASTNRFYYAMDLVFSDTDNRVAFGFSKTSAPTTAADWCKYYIAYHDEFPDYPKLGDAQGFLAIGVNVFEGGEDGNFLRADALWVKKPATGSLAACPSAASLRAGVQQDLRDAFGGQVFAPTPANQIDTAATGYILATSGEVPSDSLWLFKLAPNATGGATIAGVGKNVALPASYDIPPAADQVDVPQTIDTSDTRLSQAVLARNPRRGNAFSLWTQHTVLSDADTSDVRYYEINPTPASPSLLRLGEITSDGGFLFNAAISPDRRVDGATSAFGGSFVLTFSASSLDGSAVGAASSVNGGALSFGTLRLGVGPYVDLTCPDDGDTCRWGDYASATPDPRPLAGSAGVVWITNQFAGSLDTSSDQANWRTVIAALRP